MTNGCGGKYYDVGMIIKNEIIGHNRISYETKVKQISVSNYSGTT